MPLVVLLQPQQRPVDGRAAPPGAFITALSTGCGVGKNQREC